MTRQPFTGWDVDPRHVDEEPVPRSSVRHDGCLRWIFWVVVGVVAWIVIALVVGFFVIQLWIALTAAPRSAPDSTTLAPAHDMSGSLEGTSGPGLFGAPLARVAQWAEPVDVWNEASTEVAGSNPAPGNGGAP